MKTVWILAKSLHSAMNALRKNLKEPCPFQDEFVAFRYIGSVEQVKNLPRGQTFLVVKDWRRRPDAEKLAAVMKERNWEVIALKDLFV